MALDIAVTSKVFQWPSPVPILQVDANQQLVSCTTTDAGTNAVVPSLVLQHLSTGTPAANFGTQITFKVNDAAGNIVPIAKMQAILTTATGGAAGGAIAFLTATGGGAAVERVRIGEDGTLTASGPISFTGVLQNFGNAANTVVNVGVNASSVVNIATAAGAKIGFFQATAVVQQANASAAGIATVADAPAKAALTAIRTALVNLGLCAATA